MNLNNFYTPIQKLLVHRLEWLNKRTEVISANIAHADLKHAKRKELRSFQEILKHQDLSEKDIIQTKTPIARDLEMLEMARNTIAHDSVIHLMKSYHKMIRSIIGKQAA